MTQQSAAEFERDEQDEPVALPRRKAKRPARAVDPDDDDHGDGNGGDLRLDPESVREQIMTLLSVPPEVAGAALGLKRNTAYTACKNQEIESFKVGRKIVCPTAPLRRRLGLEPPLPGGAPVVQTAMHPKKQEQIKSPKPQRRSR